MSQNSNNRLLFYYRGLTPPEFVPMTSVVLEPLWMLVTARPKESIRNTFNEKSDGNFV
jgi:hypothetical protein